MSEPIYVFKWADVSESPRDNEVGAVGSAMMTAALNESGSRDPYVLANATALTMALGLAAHSDPAVFRAYFEEAYRLNADAVMKARQEGADFETYTREH